MLLSVPWVFQLAPCFPVSPTVENASALSFFFQGKTVLHCLVRPQFVFFFFTICLSVRWSLGCFHFLGCYEHLHRFSFEYLSSVFGDVCLGARLLSHMIILCLAYLLWISQTLFTAAEHSTPCQQCISILGFFLYPHQHLLFFHFYSIHVSR